ncbi:SixA phosphatase family protein [Cellulomonas endophytica]|uniref:SixA phosphatase family protein n=1 Tax=Cellulomonas endophytica TaxID=2494735 RepID=UPI00101384F8|nr:histidine phosphatase family protein [Cellulomonas endophytica]
MTPVTADSPRRLVLLRHARAEHPAGPDRTRPLALEGRRQAGAVGGALAAAGLVPDVVLCSSALRTRQTWDLVRQGMGAAGAGARLELRDALYESGVAELVGLVTALPPQVRTALVVGHEPTVSEAVAALAGPGSDEAALDRVRHGTPTAGWAVLEVTGGWAAVGAGTARLDRVGAPA